MPSKPRLRAARTAVVSSGAMFALAVVAVGTLSRADAASNLLSCGDTITSDITLENDLVDCPNNGVVIGADHITLDLNGHRVDGDGTKFPDCPRNTFCDVGVLDDRYDDVKIKGGSTREFGFGVFLAGARHSRVVNISSSKNVLFGAVVAKSSQSVVRDGSFSHNIAPEGDGIGLFDSDRTKVEGNSIKDNPGPGIHIDATDSLIRQNRLEKNSPSMLIDGDDNRVRHNRITRGAGIGVGPGDDNLIVANRISRADDALAVENGSGNLVARNLVVDARGFGIRLGIGNPSLGGGHNIVRRNVIKRSADDGVRVFAKDGHSLLRRNVVIRSGGDGLSIRNRTTKLAGNHVVRSADLGIAAVRGAIDQGGNVARHSGDPRQCVHVKCH